MMATFELIKLKLRSRLGLILFLIKLLVMYGTFVTSHPPQSPIDDSSGTDGFGWFIRPCILGQT